MGNNLLVYTSAPLSAPLHVFGHPEVEIHCSTSANFADLTAKLVRVASHGRAEFICIGIARSNYLFQGVSYTSDAIHCWRFALEPTSCVFLAGESIRLKIAGGAFPLYDRNPSVAGVKPSLVDAWNWKRSTIPFFINPATPRCCASQWSRAMHDGDPRGSAHSSSRCQVVDTAEQRQVVA